MYVTLSTSSSIKASAITYVVKTIYELNYFAGLRLYSDGQDAVLGPY